MADNDFTVAEATSGTTRDVAGDDIGGIYYPRVKIVWGADGVAADASATNPLPSVLGDSTANIGKIKITTNAGSVVDPIVQVAHDAPDSGEPTKMGAKAVAGLSGATLVTAADRTNMVSGLDGAIIVRTVPLEDIVSGNASNTDGTSTQVIAAAGAGIKQYLTRVTITNMHATTSAYVELKSGTTVMHTVPAPPGGSTIGFDPPLPPNAANEAWNFDPSAAVTTLYCSMVGFRSKI